jgi:C-terminal processing protease CtpA/Prc
MKKTIVFLVALAFLGGTALAGEDCTASTQDCLNKMAVKLKEKAIIGLDGEWEDANGGWRITGFAEGTTAKAAGVQKGDLLVKVNGVALTDKEGSMADAPNRQIGKQAEITVLRGGEEHTMTVTLMKMSDQMIAEAIGDHLLKGHVQVAQAE